MLRHRTIYNRRGLASTACGRNPFVIDTRTHRNDVTRLRELSSGIDRAKRMLGRSVGRVGRVVVGPADQPFSGGGIYSQGTCEQAKQQPALHLNLLPRIGSHMEECIITEVMTSACAPLKLKPP